MEEKITPEIRKESFNAFIEEYKELSLVEKQNILVNELKEMIALVEKLCIDKGINYDMLMNREILDINSDNYSQDDYVEAIYVYIQMFKDLLSTYFLSNDED